MGKFFGQPAISQHHCDGVPGLLALLELPYSGETGVGNRDPVARSFILLRCEEQHWYCFFVRRLRGAVVRDCLTTYHGSLYPHPNEALRGGCGCGSTDTPTILWII